ncbi:MAG TPA: hypothetical protein VJM79_04285, partial [Rhizorhapis sp.]|nr:hypothetical protein [Rhizorhapis sp.]
HSQAVMSDPAPIASLCACRNRERELCLELSGDQFFGLVYFPKALCVPGNAAYVSPVSSSKTES